MVDFSDVLEKKLPLQKYSCKGEFLFGPRCDSNARPSEPESDALFTKLRSQMWMQKYKKLASS